MTTRPRGALLCPPSGSEAVWCPHLSSGLLFLLGLSLGPPVDGVSPTSFWKLLLHRLLGTLRLASSGLSLFWEDPGDITGDRLTRRKSSEAGLFHVPRASLLQPSGQAQRPKPLPL